MTDRNEAGSPPERGRPELEIDLTPEQIEAGITLEMIEAGIRAFALFHPLEDLPSEIVAEIYLAMRPSPSQRR